MAEIGTTEAAGALADHFGPRLEVDRAEGRRLMADALHTHFNISTREARRLVDALEHAGTIRWIAQHTGAPPADWSHGRTPGVGVLEGDGYWQLEAA